MKEQHFWYIAKQHAGMQKYELQGIFIQSDLVRSRPEAASVIEHLYGCGKQILYSY